MKEVDKFNISTLQKKVEYIAYSSGKDCKTIFHDLLRYIIFNFSIEKLQPENWRYTQEQNKEFYSAMLIWLQVMNSQLAKREWYDPWGDLFMALTPKGGSRGQFFTPSGICDLMADVCDVQKEPTTPCGAFGKRVTVNDCACGSGRNLLAAHAKFLKAENPRKPYLIGEDIDMECCMMTAINMMSHGCFGEVICHDTLADPKGLRFGFLVNETMYPFPSPVPSLRIKTEPQWFVSLR